MELVARVKIALPADLGSTPKSTSPERRRLRRRGSAQRQPAGLEPEVARRLVDATHNVCPYSRATHATSRCDDAGLTPAARSPINPPLNVVGPTEVLDLQAIVARIEADPQVQVAVFDSAVPEYFIAHYGSSGCRPA